MSIKVGINGLGRIGRCLARAIIEEGYKDIQLMAANGPAPNATHAHLLQYDSVHGKFAKKITFDESGIDMGRGKFKVTHSRDPKEVNWKKLGVDIVLECTGHFNSKQAAAIHLKQGAKKVLISAPAGDDCPTYVVGVNDRKLGAERIVSVGSCTTNCLAPVAKVISDQFGIVSGYMTTIHAYTGDQNLVDGSHKDLRRARAAAMAMVPTKTGAAKAIGLVMPELAGKLSGTSIRVPVPNVSLIDLTVITKQKVDKDSVNDAFRAAAAKGVLKGILKVNEEPLVSGDFNHDPASAIVDLAGTAVAPGNLLRVAAWYDNEWGFSCRMLDLVRNIAASRA